MKLTYIEFRDFVHSANRYFYGQTKDWEYVTAKVGFLLEGNVTAEVSDELYEKFNAFVEAKKELDEYISAAFEKRKAKREEELPISNESKGGRKRVGKIHSRGDRTDQERAGNKG